MRGKGDADSIAVFLCRITPAYAGKSFRKTAVRHAIKDHPRLCGEKLQDTADFTHVAGSPPPMRGKGQNSTVFVESEGITPAYAGKSSRCATWLVSMKDHPRLCGEKKGEDRLYNAEHGSPPPMRGKD